MTELEGYPTAQAKTVEVYVDQEEHLEVLLYLNLDLHPKYWISCQRVYHEISAFDTKSLIVRPTLDFSSDCHMKKLCNRPIFKLISKN